jgi:aspartyl-tRNA(Asn)/glutamyl-tRNA(Gln) amidotransferase subunit C
MSITTEQVKQVAQLARLSLQPGQDEHYARQLTDIFELVGKLSRADTGNVQPMAHPLDMVQRLRPDAVTEPVGEPGREAFQAVAPAVADGLYLVPKVIE